MAKQPGYQNRSAQSGSSELQKRILFVLGALIVFRIGSFIPVPGIDTAVLAQAIARQKGTIIDVFNMFSGGALSRASIFALGIMPYISASIIVQLLVAIHPALSELKKEGESGRRKISKYTRYLTVALATVQAIGISTGLPNMIPNLVPNLGLSFYITSVISLVTGTMFLMWLGEQITERGIGNGISLIIFAGIVAGLPTAIGHTIEQARQGQMHFVALLFIALIVLAVIFFVVFVERGQRKIRIEYAKRQQGRQIVGGQSSYLPLKVNMAGVIPAIFASSIILFPATLSAWVGGENSGLSWLKYIASVLNPKEPAYLVLYAAAIMFFSFFYTGMQFNPRDTAENLKKSGAFIPGIRPGEQTARYIDKIMTRLTLIGGLYVAFVCLIPYLFVSIWNVQFSFGGTSLLIVVVVIMDFIAQVQSYLMSTKYESALKKANLSGFGQ